VIGSRRERAHRAARAPRRPSRGARDRHPAQDRLAWSGKDIQAGLSR